MVDCIAKRKYNSVRHTIFQRFFFFAFIIIHSLKIQHLASEARSPKCKMATFLHSFNKTTKQLLKEALSSQHGDRVCTISYNNTAKALKDLHVCYCSSHKLFISHYKERRKINDHFNQWMRWPELRRFLHSPTRTRRLIAVCSTSKLSVFLSQQCQAKLIRNQKQEKKMFCQKLIKLRLKSLNVGKLNFHPKIWEMWNDLN